MGCVVVGDGFGVDGLVGWFMCCLVFWVGVVGVGW